MVCGQARTIEKGVTMGRRRERLHITLRPGLKRAVKVKAVKQGVSVSAVVESCLERWLYGDSTEAQGGRMMGRDAIMEQLNADDWSTVVATFAGMGRDAIEAKLDTMFPTEDNGGFALAIEAVVDGD